MTKNPRTFSELDQLRGKAADADPLKPGMWSMDGKIGRYKGDCWEVIARADAKFMPAASADLKRFNEIYVRMLEKLKNQRKRK